MFPALTQRLRAAFLFAAALTAGVAHPAPLSIRLDGLPSGLQLIVNANRQNCTSSGGPMEPAGTHALTETSVPVIERVALPNGRFIFQTKFVPVYVAEDQVFPQSGCNRFFQFSLRVAVDRNGQTGFRRGFLRHEFLDDGTVNVHQTVQGTSDEPHISARPFVQITRGISQTVLFTNRNPFGSSEFHTLDTGLPSLSFIRPGTPTASNPFPRATVTRIYIDTDGAKCIQAGGVTKCRLGKTPALEHGGVSLDVSDRTRVENGDLVNSTAFFTFTLTSDFVAGGYTLRAQAVDLGDFDYLVQGVPTPLDLIKWVPFSQDLTVQ